MKFQVTGLILRRLVLFCALAAALPTWASEHGGGEAAAPARPEPMQFTVNVGDPVADPRYLQVTMEFDYARPEATQKLAAIKPKVQHRLILLLCGEDVGSLRTTKGKQDVQDRIVKELNELIAETPRSGVRDVFFTNFIIQ